MGITIFNYQFLLFLRFLLPILPLYGYIHPDEFFQGPEIVAGDILNSKVFTPWEFKSSFPMRSVVSSHSSSLVFLLMKFVPKDMRANLLITAPRILMVLISLLNDYSLKKLCKKFNIDWKMTSIIYASSYVTLIYFARTFSNCLEAALFSFLLLQTLCATDFNNPKAFTRKKLHANENTSSTAIALTLILGIFIRPTFVIFAAVPILLWLYKSQSVFKAISGKIIPSVIPALIITMLIIAVDTWYYRNAYFRFLLSNIKELNLKEMAYKLVVTPVNFVFYNYQTKNLENHGLHPYWLHWFVNVPLVFGVLGIYATYKFIVTVINARETNSLTLVLNFSWIVPVCGLTIFPHQEPRFLIPLILPLILLHGKKIYESKTLFTLWILGNFGCGFFYSVLHQGGITPCLFHLSKSINESKNPIELIFFRTYLPPRYLLQLDKSDIRVTITDVGEKKLEDLVNLVQKTLKSKSPQTEVYTIIPGSISSSINFMSQMQQSDDKKKFVLSRAQYFYPHLCTEDLPNTELLYRCATTNCKFWGILKQQLSLQMYKVSYI